MKTLVLILASFSVCWTASAQAVRMDPNPAATVKGNAGPGTATPILALPNAQITLCGYPAQGYPCTNLAQTYTDASAQTACPLNAQVVPPGQASCTSMTDAQGNFGWWLPPGSYTYEETWNGTVYGPYPISVPGAGNNASYIQGTPVAAIPPAPGQILTYFVAPTQGVPNDWAPFWGCNGIPAAAYGVGANNADNAPMLNLALNSAVATGEGRVCLPGGTFPVNSTIDVPDKVQLIGYGRGDPGGVNTVIQAGANFPTNSPLLTFGNLTTLIPHFGTALEDLTVDCNGVSGCIGLQDNYGEEQARVEHVAFINSGVCLQVNGSDIPSTGRVQNHGPIRDIECFPNQFAIANTPPVQINNYEEGFGFERISVVGQAGYPFNYCFQISGNSFHVESLHCEQATTAGVLLGPPGSVGAPNVFIDNVVMATGATGPAVEIYNNTFNFPKGLQIKGAEQNLSGQVAAACGSIKNDYTGSCVTSPNYIVGNAPGGVAFPLIDMGAGNTWTINNPILTYSTFQSYNNGTNANLDIKNGQVFSGCPLQVNNSNQLDVGMGGVEGCTDLNLHNGGSKLSVDSSGNYASSGINLAGPIANNGGSNPDFVDLVSGNFYWNPKTGTFTVVGDGSGYIGGLVTMNPAGPRNITGGSGGLGFISKNSLSTPTSMTSDQMAAAVQVFIPGDGGIGLTNPNVPSALTSCDANHRGRMFFLRGGSGVADHLEVCAKNAADAYNWTVVF